MRLWNRTREGIKCDRGVGTDGGRRREVSRVGRGDPDGEGGVFMGFDRSDVFRRRTGPGPDGDDSASGMRERSAMSQGFTKSGADSRVDIHGKSSKACVGALIWLLSRGANRRRRDDWLAVLVRRLEDGMQVCVHRRVNMDPLTRI